MLFYSRSNFFVERVIKNFLISKFNYGLNTLYLFKYKNLNFRTIFKRYKNDINNQLRPLILYYLSLVVHKRPAIGDKDKTFILTSTDLGGWKIYLALDYLVYIVLASIRGLGEKFKLTITKNIYITFKSLTAVFSPDIYAESFPTTVNFMKCSLALYTGNTKYSRTVRYLAFLNNA